MAQFPWLTIRSVELHIWIYTFEVTSMELFSYVLMRTSRHDRLDRLTYVEVAGEELPPIKLQVPAGYEEGTGGLRPSRFYVLLDATFAFQDFTPATSFFARSYLSK